MSRIKQAWQALTGTLEPSAPSGPPMMFDVYQVYWYDGMELRNHLYFFETCQQAHATHPNREVAQVKVVKVGREIFLVGGTVCLQPKPRRAKGKA